MVNQETVRETHHQMAMSSTVAPPGSDTESGLDGGVELGERLESDSSPSPPSLPAEVTPSACPEPTVMTCIGRAHLWQEDNLSKNLLEASDTSDHRLLMFSPYSTTNNPGTFSAWVPGSSLSRNLAPGLYGNGDRKSGDKGRLGLAAAGGKDVSQVPVFERLQSVSRYTSYQFSHHPDNINRYIDHYRAVHTVGKAGHSHRHAPTLETRLAEPHRPLVTHIIQNRGSNRSPRACLVDLSQLRQLYSSYRKFPHLWDSSSLDTCNRSPQRHRVEDVTHCDVTSMEGGSRDFPVLAAVRETVNNVPGRRKQGRKKLPQQPQTFPCLPPIGHTEISPAAVTNKNNSNSHNSGQPAAMTGMPTAESDRDGLEDEDIARAPEGKLWRNPAIPRLDLASLDTECSSTSPRSTDGQTVNTGSDLPASSSTYTSCDSLHEMSQEKTSTRFSDVYPDLTRPASTSGHQGDVSSTVSTSPAQGVNTPDTRDTPTWPPLVTTQQAANGEVRLTQTSRHTLLRRDYSHLIIEITNHPDQDLDKPNVRPDARKPRSKSSQECPDKQSGQLTSSYPQEVTAGHLKQTKSLSRLDQSPRLSFTPDLVDKNKKNGVSKTQRHHIEVPHSHRSRQYQHGDVIQHEKPLEVQGVEYSTGSHTTCTSSRQPEMAEMSRDDQDLEAGVAFKTEGRAGDMSVRLREGGKSERNKEEKEKKNQLSKSQGGKARHRIVHRKNPVIHTSGRKILSTTGLVSHVKTTHKGQREDLGEIQQVKGHKKDTRRGRQSYHSCQWHQMVDSGECGFIVRSLPAHTTARPSGHHDNDDNDNDTDDEDDAVVDSCVCESVELYYHSQPHTATLSGRSQEDDIDACLTIQAGVKSRDTESSDNQRHQVGLDCHMALSPDPTTTLHPTSETTSDATSQHTRTQETHPDGAPYLQLKENSDPQLKVRRFSSGDSATLESGGENVRMKQTNKGCLPRRPSSLEVSIPSRSNRQTLCPRVISLEGHENQGQGYSESPRIPSVTGLVGEVKVKRELQIYAHVRKGVCCDRQREVIQGTSKKSKTRGRRELLSLSGPKSDYGYFRL